LKCMAEHHNYVYCNGAKHLWYKEITTIIKSWLTYFYNMNIVSCMASDQDHNKSLWR